MTKIVDTSISSYTSRIRSTKGVMGSWSFWTSCCIRASRTIKLVADVSSSSNNTSAPTSRASIILAAWLVLPLASSVQNESVGVFWGRLVINGVIFTFSILRPSSALIFTELLFVTTYSRPSPGI